MPPPSPRARPPRPAYLAAPPLLAEAEPFEGAALLGEHPPALGALLWKSLRDVSAWTATAPEERPGLFLPGAAAVREAEVAAAGAEGETWAPLLVVARLLAAPAEPDHARLVHACRALARWAEGRGCPATQLAFTQAAARLAPAHPRLAYAVGRLARDRGEYARAESWLRSAVALARGRDWHAYALAYLSLGTLYQQLGNLPAARALTLRGDRTARRRGVRALMGVAQHNLFAIAAEMLDFTRAHEYALGAARAYGPAHPRLPVLLNDVGCFWVLHGRFALAADIFALALRRMEAMDDRLLALGNLARAAAAAAQPARFREARSLALPLLERGAVVPERAAQVWLNLARGAASLGEHADAEASAARCLAICGPLRLGQLRLEVESLRDAVSAARAAGRAVAEPACPAEAEDAGPLAMLVRELADARA